MVPFAAAENSCSLRTSLKLRLRPLSQVRLAGRAPCRRCVSAAELRSCDPEPGAFARDARAILTSAVEALAWQSQTISAALPQSPKRRCRPFAGGYLLYRSKVRPPKALNHLSN